MPARSFLILHGWQSSGPGHWQTWLAARLRAAGEHVAYPDLPDADAPTLDAWLATLAGELRALPGERTVVCHSLACILWLHHAASEPGEEGRAARVLLVAPPSPEIELSELRIFFPVPLDREAVHAAANETALVCADDDPYCPEGAATRYGEPLALPTEIVPGGGHLNTDAGFGPWPDLEAWCRGGARPLGAAAGAR
jgi:predicted alpha/beta hydrolase family esterase